MATDFSYDVNSAMYEIKCMAWAIQEAFTSPSSIYKPKVYKDGNEWCALYGENLQDGVCGFGDCPQKAIEEFNKVWNGGH